MELRLISIPVPNGFYQELPGWGLIVGMNLALRAKFIPTTKREPYDNFWRANYLHNGRNNK
jgi:hypothetical protein